MSSAPWDDPSASGFRINPPTDGENQSVVERLRAPAAANLLGKRPLLLARLIDFILEKSLEVDFRTRGGRDIWMLRFDHNRMERRITAGVRSEEPYAFVVDIRADAIWNSYDMVERKLEGWVPDVYKRWFTVTSECPQDLFRNTLDLAYHDAQIYETADLRKPLT